MGLVLRVKDAVFSKFVSVIAPPSDQFAWFDFGVDYATSITDKSGKGNNLSALGATTGITFTETTAIFPQRSSSQNVLVLKILATGSYTMAGKLKAGQFERLGSFPVASSTGILVDSGGLLSLVVYTSDATKLTVTTPSSINRPINYVASVDTSVVGKVTLKLKTKDAFGVVSNVSQTFDAVVGAAYPTADLRIGDNAVGSMEVDEMIFYKRALSDIDAEQLLTYFDSK